MSEQLHDGAQCGQKLQFVGRESHRPLWREQRINATATPVSHNCASHRCLCRISGARACPGFHSQSALLFLPPTLSQKRHTGWVHYYSPGLTGNRIIAPLSTAVSGGGGGGRVQGRSKRRLMIDKNKLSVLFSVSGCACTNLLRVACMSSSLTGISSA